ncbi:hypothetical protein MalM25_09870 [Planctomycetes bacterium MalM25]|nr:hypothetical protein MalM25_09870 [Planctomycetes bacterium MalM25]
MKVHEVIKVGGSLFAEPNAMRLVADWLVVTRRADTVRLLVAGGGPSVDALRVIDAANPLSTVASHWAAVQIMDANTRLLTEWLPGVDLTDSLRDLRPGDSAWQVRDWLRETEPTQPGEPLRPGWQTTSDSIAARLASVTGARLTLLKHSLTKAYATPEAAAAAGVVDPELPRHTEGVPGFRLCGAISPGLGGT